jgi:formylglycine-generating enzyme
MKQAERVLGLAAAMACVAGAASSSGCGSRTAVLLTYGGGGGDNEGGPGADGGFDTGDEMDTGDEGDTSSDVKMRHDGSGGPSPPSCASGTAGMNDCGASHHESCCASDEVSGGTFYRTYVNMGTGPTGTSDPAMISTFRLDRYEVTVGRFRQFRNAWNNGEGYVPPPGSGKHSYLNGGQGLANSTVPGTFETGWVSSDNANIDPEDRHLACDPPGMSFATWTPSPGMNENLPINCVNWQEAYAFCIYDGGFLPSEAEWEYAAAGGDREQEFPWGEVQPGSDSSYAIYECDYPGGVNCANTESIGVVGSTTLGVGVFGQYDLAGNVAEWAMDWWDDPGFSYADPCTDCAYLSPPPDTPDQPYRIIRGGGFNYELEYINPWYRDWNQPAGRGNTIGFRCARPPATASDP